MEDLRIIRDFIPNTFGFNFHLVMICLPHLPEVGNNVKFPLHMECLVLY